ncbi:MAG: DMT family transporter [Alphaproteobacteria bacterium]|nr:DMT family transporter [Alphaproteobacteria bacterium]
MTTPAPRAADNLGGMVLMLIATVVLISQHSMAKHVSETLPVLQVVFFRTITAFLFFLPWILRSGLHIFRTDRIGLHVVRALLQTVSSFTFFLALKVTALATVTALHFTAPIFATVIAVFALGERISVRRGSAILLAFAGTYVILRPGFGEIDHGAVLAVVSALCWGIAMIFIKVMSRTNSSVTITAYMYLLMTPLTFLVALYDWQWPTLIEYGWLILIGVTGALGHLLMAESLKRGDTHVVTPLDFFRLIWATLAGYFLFAEFPDLFVWIGGTMIFGGVSYIAWREHVLYRRRNGAS